MSILPRISGRARVRLRYGQPTAKIAGIFGFGITASQPLTNEMVASLETIYVHVAFSPTNSTKKLQVS